METLTSLAQALEASPFGVWARSSSYAYPAANLIHLLGLVMLAGGIGLVDLRLAGLWRRLPPDVLSRCLTPVAIAGLALMLPSGFVLFAADAGPLLKSPLFQRKIILIAIALVNAAAFRILWSGYLGRWDLAAPVLAKLMAGASVLLWLIVAALGRLIAYT